LRKYINKKRRDDYMLNVYFAKIKEKAIIPSKRKGDAGYDIYACIDEDIYIRQGETKLIPTGLISSISDGYVFQLNERGSTGTRGMAQRCGIIDASYTGEWFVPINNTGTKPLLITNHSDKIEEFAEITVYPTNKAITQFLILPVPETIIHEVYKEDILNKASERGGGALGSSGK
jgi:dUTP pyrophosphatase